MLGPAHVYGSPGNHEVFFHDEYYFGGHKIPYDPEGILGSINSIVIVFLGLQLGKILQFYQDEKSRVLRLGVWGGALLCIGGGLTGLQPRAFYKNKDIKIVHSYCVSSIQGEVGLVIVQPGPRIYNNSWIFLLGTARIFILVLLV